MHLILGGWAFGMFLWTKVMFEAFRSGITVLGALLIAILFAIFIYLFSSRSEKIFESVKNSPTQSKINFYYLLQKSFMLFLVYSLSFIFLARLVIVGFSQELNREMEFLNLNRYNFPQFVYFVTIMLLPCGLFYVFNLFRALKNPSKI
jgi:hypothetical protein